MKHVETMTCKEIVDRIISRVKKARFEVNDFSNSTFTKHHLDIALRYLEDPMFHAMTDNTSIDYIVEKD